MSSASAVSFAEKPRTSRRISAARWFAGRCWRAATNASSTLSRCSKRSAGPGDAVLDLEPLVRVGLDPDRLGDRLAGSLVGVGGGPVVDREDPLRPLADHVERGVGRDLVHPRAQRAAVLEPGDPLPGAKQRVLERVLGVVDGAEHPVAVGVQLARGGARPGARMRPRRRCGRRRAARAARRSRLSVGSSRAPP